MSTKRKRKHEVEDEADSKWELANILNEELREEMTKMWEIPQIFHFLYMSKEVLNISHLSMYEVERMLAMPRASKQLAIIMTALLGPSYPKAKAKKIPPMPYDFWVNVLTHKVKGWFKVYQSKHQDVAKVLDAIGVEPDFWRIFPDTNVIDELDFERLTFKQRVWILKSLCDTVLHSRKTVQEEVAKQTNEDSFEFVLGSDRYGAKFIYFPMFLDNDIRVYRHCIDNTILSTVKPPVWKEMQSAKSSEKMNRSKRKRPRWKNGDLPRDRKRRKNQEDELKMSCDSAIGSSMNEDTNFSSMSSCSNNNTITMELSEGNHSRCPSKASEPIEPSEGNRSTSPSKETKLEQPSNEREAEESFRGFESKVNEEENSDTIDGINGILDKLTTTVSSMVKTDDSEDRTMDTDNSTIEDKDKEDDEELSSLHGNDTKYSDSEECPQSRAESDDMNWIKHTPRTMRNVDPETRKKEISAFTQILADLAVSTFELAADSIESLRDLVAILKTPEMRDQRLRPAPASEVKLALAIEDFIHSLKDAEPKLRESTKKARTKLRREWTNYRDAVKDQDTSSGSNGWIIGSQGCPEFTLAETDLQALPDPALSPASPKNSDEHEDERTRDVKTESNEDSEDGKDDGAGGKEIKSQKKEPDESKSEDEDEYQPRRVLRARGISSYNEQLSSDEDESFELEKWSISSSIYPPSGTSGGSSYLDAFTKANRAGNESQTYPQRDWILPGARKRNNTCPYLGGSVKSHKPKTSNQKKKSHARASNVSPPVPGESAILNSHSAPKNTLDRLCISKVETVRNYSEMDIKKQVAGTNSGLSQHHQQNPTYEATNNPRPSRLTRPPPAEITSQSMLPGYGVQGPQTFYDPRFMRYPYPGSIRGDLPYGYHQPLSYPGQYWQPPGFPSMPGLYPTRAAAPQTKRVRGQRTQRASTTLYGARMPSQMPQNPTMDPRSFSVTNPALRFPSRPRAPLNGPQMQVPTASSRRVATRQIPPPKRMPAPSVRPSRPGPNLSNPNPNPSRPSPNPSRPSPNSSRPGQNATQSALKQPVAKKPAPKTTSVILLSDSDDEIEMIVPDKQTTVVSKPVADRKATSNKNNSPATPPASKTKTRPVVTSEITVPKVNSVLSPQMIQRMSQGGISITPVKPAVPKDKTDDNSQSPKLVVVVNETGNHYALALPNGSKLILTPEQVAQIRASNGGKLVL